jgi:glutamyl-tRNA reductase
LSQLICVGLNHKTTPVEIRELAAIPTLRQSELLLRAAAGQVPGISELAILSTCNRTELYAVGLPDVATHSLTDLLVENSPLADYDWEGYLYTLYDDDCVEHLLRVASGLDSQVIGEPQILGQVTEAYEQASANKAAGPVLSTLMQQAIHTGKRVRHETAIGQGALTISSIVAAYSNQLIGPLQRACVLIIGAGEMAQSAAAAFVRLGIDHLLVANRTLEHAQEIAEQWHGEAVPFTQLGEALLEADLVIAAAFAPHTLLHLTDLDPVLARRAGRPLIIFDIALPRNVAPDVAGLPGVKLYNLDDLQAVSDSYRAQREGAIPQAETIVEEEALAFAQWRTSRAVVPVIQQLRAKAESIREAELDHLLRRLPEISERERQLIEEFSQRLVNKLLHNPTLKLKEHSADGPAELYANVLDELFDLRVDLDA